MSRAPTLLLLVATLGIVACGGSSKGGSTGALSGEARSAATGDIPDNQVFLTYRNRPNGYSISYPEGWAVTGRSREVRFEDKNNIVHVVIGSGAAPTPSSAAAELARQRAATPSLRVVAAPRTVRIAGKRAVKAVYTTTSAPSPVTGRRVLLVVDRYELGAGGRLATVDLGTPRGVDNVDAYRMMIESFRWL